MPTISPVALAELSNLHKGPIITPDSPEYPSAIDRFFKSSVRQAGAVAFPADEADIKTALAWARGHSVELVVKGGGHSVSAASSTDGGLVIDLSRSYKTVEIDLASSTAVVGGGAKWGDVDQATIKHGLAVVGGTNDDTGVAGLTLGGGFGWRSSSDGLVCDNVLEFRVVTADGRSAVVTADTEPDLWFALRGGGGSFAVVTHFVFRLHPQRPDVYFHQSMHGHDSIKQLVDIVETGNKQGDSRSNISMGLVPGPGGQAIVVALGYFNGSAEEGKVVFEPINALKPVMAQELSIPYERLNTMMNAAHPPGELCYMTSTMISTFQPDLLLALSERHRQMTEANPGFKLQVLCQPFRFKVGSSVAPDAAAFPYRSPQLCIVAFVVIYERPDQKEEARSLARQLRDGPPSANQPALALYSNADSGGEGRLKNLYGANWPRLVEIKRAVDPTGVLGGRQLLAAEA